MKQTGLFFSLAIVFMLLLLMQAAGCVRFNTYYNAAQAYKEAEQMARSRAPDSRPARAELTKLDQCLEKCGVIIARHPGSKLVDDALFLMAKALALKVEHASSAQKFKELRLYFPDSPFVSSSYYLEAQERTKLRQYELAEEVLEIHLELSSRWDEWQERSALLFAEICKSRDDCDLALERLENVIANVEKKEILGPAYLLQGGCLRTIGKTSLAVVALDEADRFAPSRELRFRAGLEKGEVLALLGDGEEALETFQNLHALARADSELAQVGLSVGRSWVALGDFDEAEGAFRNVIEAYPNVEAGKRARMELATMLEKQKRDFGAALLEYEELSKQSRPRILIEEAGRRAKALRKIEELKEALTDSGSNRGRALVELAETFLIKLQLPDSAAPYFRLAFTDYPESVWAPRALYTEAWIHRSVGDTLTAADLRARLQADYPSSAEARTIMALEGIIPKEATGMTEAHWFSIQGEKKLLHGEEPEKSLEIFSSLADSFPDSPEAPRALLACAWISSESLGDTSSAREYLERLREFYPKTDEGRRASIELGAGSMITEQSVYDVPPEVVRLDTIECVEISRVDSLTETSDVLVRVLVDSTGNAGDVELVAGTGSLLCDDAAMLAAREAEYKAALRDSIAVEAWLELRVPFFPTGKDTAKG